MPNKKIIFLVTLIIGFSANLVFAELNRAEVLTQTQGFMKTKELKKAEKLLFALAQENPKDDEILFTLGTVYSWQKKYKDAIFYFEKALKNNPQNLSAGLSLARVLSWQGQTDLAIIKLKVLDKNNLRNLEIILLLGKYTRWVYDFIESEKYLLQGLQIDPNNEDFLIELGLCYAYNGKAEKAENVYKSILKINPKNADALKYLSQIKETVFPLVKLGLSYDETFDVDVARTSQNKKYYESAFQMAYQQNIYPDIQLLGTCKFANQTQNDYAINETDYNAMDTLLILAIRQTLPDLFEYRLFMETNSYENLNGGLYAVPKGITPIVFGFSLNKYLGKNRLDIFSSKEYFIDVRFTGAKIKHLRNNGFSFAYKEIPDLIIKAQAENIYYSSFDDVRNKYTASIYKKSWFEEDLDFNTDYEAQYISNPIEYNHLFSVYKTFPLENIGNFQPAYEIVYNTIKSNVKNSVKLQLDLPISGAANAYLYFAYGIEPLHGKNLSSLSIKALYQHSF